MTVGLLFSWVFVGVYVWMLFAFPNGTIWNRWALAVLVLVFVWQLLLYLPALLFMPRRDRADVLSAASEVPSYFYVGHGWSGLARLGEVWWVGQAVLWVLRRRRPDRPALAGDARGTTAAAAAVRRS